MSYHRMLDAETKLFGLIGHPVKMSVSPVIHNAAFKYLGQNSVYLAFDVLPEKLRSAVVGLRDARIKGFNVTTPHKVKIIEHLDRLDHLARKIGAANTVTNNGGTLTGLNTDITGIIQCFNTTKANLRDSSSLLIGCGGAARACLLALHLLKVREVIIANRTLAKAEKLALEARRAHGIDVRSSPISERRISRIVRDVDVIINATPLGSVYTSSKVPITHGDIRDDTVVFDLVYCPAMTTLLKEARKAGAETIDGIKLLVTQASESFRIWTGKKPPVHIMEKAALNASRRWS